MVGSSDVIAMKIQVLRGPLYQNTVKLVRDARQSSSRSQFYNVGMD